MSVLVCLAGVLRAASAQEVPLTVEECVRLALARSPAIRAARSGVEAAEERVRAGRAAYQPKLLGQAEYGRSGGFDEAVTNGGSAALGVTLEALVLDGGRRAAELAAARARFRSAAAAEKQRQADTAFEVRAAYFSALAARDEANVHAEAVRRLEDDQTLLERLESRGLVPRNDVLRARLAAAAARSAQRSALATLAIALTELGVLTEAEVEARALAAPPPVVLESPAPGAIDASPVLEDARAAVEAARDDTDAVRSERREQVAFTATAGFLGVDPETAFRDHEGAQFLLGFTLPLFDGGVAAARVAAAVADTSSAEATAELARRTLSLALARVDVTAGAAQSELDASEGAVPEAEEALDLMRARYLGGGNVTVLEVVDALNQVVEARLNVLRAQMALRLAAAQQDQLLGRVSP